MGGPTPGRRRPTNRTSGRLARSTPDDRPDWPIRSVRVEHPEVSSDRAARGLDPLLELLAEIAIEATGKVGAGELSVAT